VDAYVQTGDFVAAKNLTIRIQTRDPQLVPFLCTYWSEQTTLPAGLYESILQKLECVQEESQ
jgi:hypothetical protein